MGTSRRAVAFLLTVTVTVAPMQGAMAEHDEMSGAETERMEIYTELSSTSSVESPGCSHHPDNGTYPDGFVASHNTRRGETTTQSVGDAHACNCDENCQCACCNKSTTAPALPSLFLAILISSQTEEIQTYLLFSSTFVLVQTRPPTSRYLV